MCNRINRILAQIITIGVVMSALGTPGCNTSPQVQRTNAASESRASVLDQPKTLTVDIGGFSKMDFVLIQPGEFMMGSANNEEGRRPNEGPQHKVEITKPLYLGKYPVTQAQYAAVMEKNPSEFKGKNRPVEQVSWNDCMAFINRLNTMVPGYAFRMPTEAEWEYACRAETRTRYYCGDDDALLGSIAWYGANAGHRTHDVGEKTPNAFGLYDMSGNVYEWCSDWYAESYINAQEKDPTGPKEGVLRVMHGGYWNTPAPFCRSAHRHGASPGFLNSHVGLRLALDAK